MITVDDQPVGRRSPAGYGQTEVMGLATFNALQPSIGIERAARTLRAHRHARPRRRASSARARRARSASAGPR